MPDENRTECECDCDCHRADAGGLVCSRCWGNHRAAAERKVAEDIPVILRAFAEEDDDDE